jgi:signal transduction histidine kinase
VLLISLARWADRRRFGGRRTEVAVRGWAADAALAVGVAGVDLLGSWQEAHSPVQGDPTLRLPPVPWWGYSLVLLAGLALVWRRKSPLASFVAVTGLTFAYTALGYNDGAPLLAVAVSLYSLATVLNPKPVWVALAVAVVACGAAEAFLGPFGVAQGPLTVLPWELAAGAGIGFFVASRRAQAARSMERSEEQARWLVEQERLRIARELHDVVAHSMATINVQAGVALHLLKGGFGGASPAAADQASQPVAPSAPAPAVASPTQLARAVEAMEAVRVTSKEALRELRGILSLLRSSSEQDETAPAPRLSQVGDLAEMTSKAGLPVDLRVMGERRDLPPAVDLAAYRIVQEALTNSLRHAGPARATVTLGYGPDRLVLEVLDDGHQAGSTSGPGLERSPTSPTAQAGSPSLTGGKGLLGMRERAEALGGLFEAGPLAGGGFRVRAELPLPTAEQAASKATPEPEGAVPAAVASGCDNEGRHSRRPGAHPRWFPGAARVGP